MEFFKSDAILFYIIFIVGILTILTDLKLKKIYNIHLVIGAVLGVAILTFKAVWIHQNIFVHILNGAVAFIIGYCFHIFNLWRGGDAKLFTLYAFLMPQPNNYHMLLASSISLFACSFIVGTILLSPIFIKDFISFCKSVIKTNKHLELYEAIKITFFFSWILFPVYHFCSYLLAKFVDISFISLSITFVIFYIIRPLLEKRIKISFTIACCGIIFGLLARFWLSPSSLFWATLPYSIGRTILFSILSPCIYILLTDEVFEYKDRIPFAPLLFIGCILSYTLFLTSIMRFLRP